MALQQSFADFAFAPRASWAAVGWPCIWRCASWDDAAVLPEVWFIVAVGGCSLLRVVLAVLAVD